MNEYTFAKFAFYYSYLYKKIILNFNFARKNNKKILLLIGENHSSDAHNFLEFCTFDIAHKLGIKNFYHECSANTQNYQSPDLKSRFRFKQTYDDLSIAEKYQFKYIPIDLSEDKLDGLGISPISEKGLKLRNSEMVKNINLCAEDGIAIVGASHCIGMVTNLEGNYIDREIFEIVTLDFSTDIHLNTIPTNLLRTALDYYRSSNINLRAMAHDLNSFFQAPGLDNLKVFLDFINLNRAQDYEDVSFKDEFKRTQAEFENHFKFKSNSKYMETLLYRLSYSTPAPEKSFILIEIENVLKSGCDPNFILSGGQPAVFEALYKGYRIFELFLQYGADPNSLSNDYPLLYSALDYDINSFQLLLEFGANPFSHAIGHESILQKAKAHRKDDAVAMILHFQKNLITKENNGECLTETLWSRFSHLLSESVDTLAESISQSMTLYVKDVVNSCPSYFPPGNYHYWNTRSVDSSQKQNIGMFHIDNATTFIGPSSNNLTKLLTK